MANMVEIVIKVDNAQANAAIAATTASLKQAGVAGQVSMQQLGSGSSAAVQGLNQVGTAARTMGGHMTTSLDGVRLLSQEFGLRLPRALESMLSRMPAVTSAIQGLMGAFAGIAIAEVFVRASEAAYNLYNKYISLTAAAEEYNKTVQKHKDEDFVNTRSIEETKTRLDEATRSAAAFKGMGEEIHNGAWGQILAGISNPTALAAGFGNLLAGRQLTDAGYKSQGQADALSQKQIAQNHELNVLAIERAHAADAELRGQQKISAEFEKRRALTAENRRFDQEQSSSLQGVGITAAGRQKQQLEDQIAQGEAAAQAVALQREITEKTISLQNEANNARLQGGALYLAQELQSEAAIRRSGIGTQQEIEAIRLKYHNDQMKRIEEENEQVRKRTDAERIAGLTGIAKIQAQGQQRIGDIDDRERKGLYADQSAPGQSSKQAAQDRATATTAMYREMGEAQKQYDEEQQAGIDRNNAAMLTGFAKIDHELQESSQRRADAFSKMYSQMAQDSEIYRAAQARDAVAGQSEIDNAIRERGELEDQITQKTLEDDKQASEAERRVHGEGLDGWLSKYRDTVQEIESAHTAMIAKIQVEQSKPGVTDAANVQYEKQKVDADRIANAQILDANQQMAHQLAGTLEGAFSDPVHFIQNKMKSMMFEIVADWLLQTSAFKNMFGNQMGGLSIGGGAKSGGGGFAGSPIGGLAHMLGLAGGGSAASSTSPAGGYSSGAITGVPTGTSPAAPGFGAAGSGVGSPGVGLGIGFGGTSSTPTGLLGDLGSLAGTSSAAVNALDPWDDPTKMSSSDPTSSAFHSAGAGAGGFADGASTAEGIIGAGVGAYTGFMGVEGAFESGSASGILSGAASGAELGAAVGMLAGPVGAGIGGAIGAAGGAITGLVGWASGEGGRIGAAKFYKTQMLPQMQAVESNYERSGTGSASDAISQLNTVAASGYASIATKYGSSSAAWARANYIDKERQFVEQQINRLAQGGHDYLQTSAVQFHSGGTVRGFGDLATSSTEGFIHAMMGEKVVNPSASRSHGPYIDAMNSGASQAEIAGMYLRSSSSPAGGDTHNHYYEGHTIKALDASDFEHYLNHRGGYQAISRAETRATTRYAGEGDYG